MPGKVLLNTSDSFKTVWSHVYPKLWGNLTCYSHVTHLTLNLNLTLKRIFWIEHFIITSLRESILSLILLPAGRRAFASGGPAWRPGAAGTSESWRALDSGESPAAAGSPPLQTQHHHLLHEAQVDPHALEAWTQGRLQRGDGASGGEPGFW